MTPDQVLDHVLDELRRVSFPDENTDPEGYWNMVECETDNATDAICDSDQFVKNLIDFIEKNIP